MSCQGQLSSGGARSRRVVLHERMKLGSRAHETSVEAGRERAHSGGGLVKLPVMGLLRRGNHQAGGFGWPQISGLLAESPSGVWGFRCAALSDCWNRQAGDSISTHERALGGIAKRGAGGGSLFRVAVGALIGITKR